MLIIYASYVVFLLYCLKTCFENYQNVLIMNLSVISIALIIFLALIEIKLRKKIGPIYILALKGIITIILTILLLFFSLILESIYSQILQFYLYHIQWMYYSNYKGYNRKLCLIFLHLFCLSIFIIYLSKSCSNYSEWIFLLLQQPLMHFIIFQKHKKILNKSGFAINLPQTSSRQQPSLSECEAEIQSLIFLQDIFNIFPFGVVILDEQSKVVNSNLRVQKYLESNDPNQIVKILTRMLLNAYLQQNTNEQRNRNLTALPIKKIQDLQNWKQIGIEKNKNLQHLSEREGFIQNSLKDINRCERKSSTIEIAKIIMQDNQKKMSSNKTLKKCKNLKIEHKNRIFALTVFEMAGNQKPIKSNKQNYILIIVQNITNKESYRKINQKHQFQSLLLNSFSHELRTPLNCSLQLQQILYTKINQQLQQQFLKPSIINTQKLSHQLNDILDYASLEGNSFQLKIIGFELGEIFRIIEDYYQLECDQKGIQLKFELEGCQKDEIIHNDQERIIQILVNLMNNAVKFTKQNGHILFKAIKLNSSYNFSVEDDGIGISLDKLLRITAILQQQRSKIQDNDLEFSQYVGLGLKISNRIAGYLITSGLIEINSIEKQFTRASFSFQNFKNQRDHKNSIQQEPPIQSIKFQGNLFLHEKLKKLTCLCTEILICDDVPFNHLALQTLLKSFGLTIDNAYDGYQAVEKIKIRKENKCQYHCQYKLIFMDIEMPGMDGFEATQELLKIDEKLNIIMCSAYDSKNNIEHGLKCGMKEILEKPVKLNQLQRILKKYQLIF